MRVKKIASIVDNLTESEQKRRQLITEIQGLHKSGTSIREIARITGKERKTIRKYLDGDPDTLCRSNKHSQLASCTDSIVKKIKEGLTASAIAKQLQEQGHQFTLSNIRQFVTSIARQYGLEISKYNSTVPKYKQNGENKASVDYITRKGVFNHLWMNIRLTPKHKEYIWSQNSNLSELERCIREFREIFDKKSMPCLYLFIDRYKNSSIKEIATFANGLEKDIDAVENAVASPLSNGFVEGTNSKVKTIKKAMYGRCGKLLLSAKLMYKPRAEY
jgi:predicted transcriptional regulator